jgi:molybdate transport system ATP-binding protein
MLHTASGPQLFDVQFELNKGSLLSLYGPSGAGKTTLLRILAGLTATKNGRIEVDGDCWLDSSRKIDLATRHRSIGFVFQDFALFPNLTVKEQLEYALPKNENKTIVDTLLEMMELTALRDRRPDHLSGGQRQRVALARAIARRPRLLLLDEPLSALDDEMRRRLQEYILKAHRHYQLTTILVSHYLPEILRLSDDVILLENGRIVRRGAPAPVFLEEKIGSMFKAAGEIIGIAAADDAFIVSVSAANTIIKVIATADEAASLQHGQKVIVASEAFNPIILPITD